MSLVWIGLVRFDLQAMEPWIYFAVCFVRLNVQTSKKREQAAKLFSAWFMFQVSVRFLKTPREIHKSTNTPIHGCQLPFVKYCNKKIRKTINWNFNVCYANTNEMVNINFVHDGQLSIAEIVNASVMVCVHLTVRYLWCFRLENGFRHLMETSIHSMQNCSTRDVQLIWAIWLLRKVHGSTV